MTPIAKKTISLLITAAVALGSFGAAAAQARHGADDGAHHKRHHQHHHVEPEPGDDD
jgi:hypothetical protein